MLFGFWTTAAAEYNWRNCSHSFDRFSSCIFDSKVQRQTNKWSERKDWRRMQQNACEHAYHCCMSIKKLQSVTFRQKMKKKMHIITKTIPFANIFCHFLKLSKNQLLFSDWIESI